MKRSFVCSQWFLLSSEITASRVSAIFLSVTIFSSGQSPSENIITSGNITPNPPRSGSINDKYSPGSGGNYQNLTLSKC